MKTPILFLVALTLAGTSAVQSASPARITPERAAASLEAQAKKTLGVGLRSLSFLFEARPGIFLLKDSLVDDGSWPQLQALEKAGYVRSKELKSANGVFLQVELTENGKRVVAQFR